MVIMNICGYEHHVEDEYKFIELVKMYMGIDAYTYIKDFLDSNESYIEFLELSNESMWESLYE